MAVLAMFLDLTIPNSAQWIWPSPLTEIRIVRFMTALFTQNYRVSERANLNNWIVVIYVSSF
jgi:hypothetical protein